MAKRSDRVPLYSALSLSLAEKPIRWLKVADAAQMQHERKAVMACAYCGTESPHSMTCAHSPNRAHWMFAKLVDVRRVSRRSPCTLTFADMVQNAAAAADHRSCRARSKVEAWPHVHDTQAVTVVAGRGVFVPKAQEASGGAVR